MLPQLCTQSQNKQLCRLISSKTLPGGSNITRLYEGVNGMFTHEDGDHHE